MRRAPIVSVIMPVYNGAVHLCEAIESILRQSFADFELVLIDDRSTDASAAVADYYAAADDRIRFIRNGVNRGVVESLNIGLREAAGAFMARLDQDDVAVEYRLDQQVRFLQAHDSVVLIGSNMLAISVDGEAVGEVWNPESPAQIKFAFLFNNPIADPTVMCRLRAIRANNLAYDADYGAAEDYQMWSEVTRHGDAYNSRDRLTHYRIHPDQMTQKSASELQASAEKISARLLRTVDPSFSLTWQERRLLNWQYRLYLKIHAAGADHDDSWLHREVSAKLTPLLTGGYLAAFESLQSQRVLPKLARRFVAVHGTEDPVLNLLSKCS